MLIPVVTAVGRNVTELAAFDAALVTAGVADRNLIYLSSVLPPASAIRHVRTVEETPGRWGDRLYVVMAQNRTSTPGATVSAGIGWVQDDTGRGLLVEHHARNEGELKSLLDRSLDGLLRNRSEILPHRGYATITATCARLPLCVLAVAVFEHAAWRSSAR